MNRKSLTIMGVVLLSCILNSKSSAQKRTTSELLQKGIYLQETVGDLDGAIKVYRQIVHQARESRANAAQAEFRLGECLLKKGRHAEAVSTLQALIKEYPEQTEIVAKARQFTENAQAADAGASVGHFIPTGELEEPRYEQNSVLLPNGKVLIVGGAFSKKAELYDPATGLFHTNGSMKEIRGGVSTATLLPNGKVLIAGGSSCSTAAGCPMNSAELYDQATGSFVPTGAMNVARYAHTATLLPNGNVLIAGGIGNNSESLTSAELYDLNTGSFTLTGAMIKERNRHTATLLPSGTVLIAGGFAGWNKGAYLVTAELYDPATGKFRPTGFMTASRMSHTATLLSNGKVLMTGGVGSPGINGYHNTAELYDPSMGRFAATGMMAIARVGHTATLLANGRVLIVGGVNTPPGGKYVMFNTAEL